MTLLLPDKRNICVTGPTDPTHRHYQFGVRYFMNKRLEMALELLEGAGGVRGRFLDAGCGGGVFLPELSRYSDRLYAIDIHRNLAAVEQMCKNEEIKAHFSCASLKDIPFQDETFDTVISISVLEFVDDLERAVAELKRVLKKSGRLIVGFPVLNYVTRLGYFLIGCFIAEKVHTATHTEILAALNREFKSGRVNYFPKYAPSHAALYACGLFSR
ncbi:MAG: class I SAM-dependent methyltransferase [Candidatus Omnitrophica bacterium]|nr:class I SAM-dependent methyltransferase [Candidatus Omnitrophota bacterium]